MIVATEYYALHLWTGRGLVTIRDEQDKDVIARYGPPCSPWRAD